MDRYKESESSYFRAIENLNTTIKQHLVTMGFEQICIDAACQLYEEQEADEQVYDPESLIQIIYRLAGDSIETVNIKYVPRSIKCLIYGFFRKNHKTLFLDKKQIYYSIQPLIADCCISFYYILYNAKTFERLKTELKEWQASDEYVNLELESLFYKAEMQRMLIACEYAKQTSLNDTTGNKTVRESVKIEYEKQRSLTVTTMNQRIRRLSVEFEASDTDNYDEDSSEEDEYEDSDCEYDDTDEPERDIEQEMETLKFKLVNAELQNAQLKRRVSISGMEKEALSLLCEQPRVTIQMVSEFMERLSLEVKDEIWASFATGQYIEKNKILHTLHAFAGVCIKIKDSTAIVPSRHDMEKELVPFADVIRQRTENANGMNLEEFKQEAHDWILEPVSGLLMTSDEERQWMEEIEEINAISNNDMVMYGYYRRCWGHQQEKIIPILPLEIVCVIDEMNDDIVVDFFGLLEGVESEKVGSLELRNDELQRKNEELIEKNQEIMMENSMLKERLQAMEIEMKQLKAKIMLMNVENYNGWRWKEILEWILSIEDGRFKKYEQELRNNMSSEEVTGQDLVNVDVDDVKRWGIVKFADIKILCYNIRQLVQKQMR